jgi:V/A-type H+/Na+-transporting ATPase subunit D
MRKVSCTRMELLSIEAQISLAKQGYDLLEQKRTALMNELLQVADTVYTHNEMLQQAADEARQSLARAERCAGVEAVHSAAIATRAELPLQVTAVNVMGVKVPHIEQRRVSRSALGRGFSIVGTSTTIDEAAEAFETQVNAMIQLAESELRLKRLAVELRQTTRRLNALEHFLIPEMIAERDLIQMTLDERERTDHFRLKMVKRVILRRRGQNQGGGSF